MSRVMKDSNVDWLGQIPTRWNLERAKFVFKQSSSKGNANLVLLSATQDRGVVDKSTLEGVVQVAENADLNTFKTVHINDFVISLRSFQGGFELSHCEGVISPAYTVFRLREGDYVGYYKHLFKSSGFIDKINSLTVGIREGKNIQYDDFSNMLIPVLSVSEQQTIADFLDKKCDEIDEMVALQERIIDELKAYKQSKVKELIDSYLKIEPYSTVKIGGVSSLVTKQTGFDYSNTISPSLVGELSETTIPYLQTKNFKDGYWNYNTDYYIPKEIAARFPKLILNKKSLLFSIVGASIGNVAVFPATTIAFLGGAICKVDLIDERNYDYIKNYMLSYYGQEQISSKITASAQGTITVQNVRDFKVPMFNDIQVQNKITNEINALSETISSLIKAKQAKIEHLKEYKKSIIYEYVTGKKEVPHGE